MEKSLSWKKKCNINKRVPVLLLADSIPSPIRRPGPFQNRLIRLPLRNPIEDLSEERLIATFWGCMKRRISALPQKASQLNQAPEIRYNQTSVKLIDYLLKKEGMNEWSFLPATLEGEISTSVYEDNENCVICTDQGEFCTSADKQFAPLEKFTYQYGDDIGPEDQHFFLPENESRWEELAWINMSVRENTLRGDPLSLFRFAIIPLEKKKGKINRKEGIIKAFKNPTGNFRFVRHEEPNLLDYMVWPLRAAVRVLDPSKFDRYSPHVTRDSPKGTSLDQKIKVNFQSTEDPIHFQSIDDCSSSILNVLKCTIQKR